MMKLTKRFIALIIFILLVIPFVAKESGIGIESHAATVNITYIFDAVNIIEQDPISGTYGSKITIDVPTAEDYVFAFWVVNGVVRTNPSNNQFIVVDDMEIQAIFKPEGQFAAVFIDSNGKYLDAQFTTSGGSVTPPSTVGLSKPGLSIKETGTWRDAISQTTSLTNILSDRVYVLQYETTSLSSFTVTVTNGSVVTPAPITEPEEKYNFNQIVQVTAPSTFEDTDFSHWEDSNGFRLSYSLNYSFTVASNITLTAVYDEDIIEKPLVAMSDDLSIRDGYRTYMGQFYVPTGYELVEYGFLISNLATPIKKGDANVITARNSFYTEGTNEYVMSFPEDSHSNARAYLTVKEISSGDILTVNSNKNIVYSTGITDLFISEYVEGSGTNKAIEIYNGTDSSINLSNYSIRIYSNGSATVSSTINLNNYDLQPNEVYVVYNSSNTAITSVGNQSSGSLSHNGDDAIALAKNGVNIDVIGVIGDATSFGQDKTFVRKENINSGVVNFNISEWNEYPIDTFSNLGNHISNSITGLSYNVFSNMPTINGTSNLTLTYGDSFNPNQNVSIYDNIDSYVNLSITVTYNDVVVDESAYSLLPIGTYNVTYFAENSLSYKDIKIIELIVTSEVVEPQQLTITLSDFGTSGGSYAANTPRNFTESTFDFTTGYWLPNSGNIQGQASTFYLYNLSSLGNIQSVVITLTAASAHSVYFGSSSNPTTGAVTASISGNVYTYENIAGSGYFKIQNNANAIYIVSIVINYIPE